MLLLAAKFCPSVWFQASLLAELLQCVHRSQPTILPWKEQNSHLLTLERKLAVCDRPQILLSYQGKKKKQVLGTTRPAFPTYATFFRLLTDRALEKQRQSGAELSCRTTSISQQDPGLTFRKWSRALPTYHMHTHRKPSTYSHSSFSFPWHSHFCCHKLGIPRGVLQGRSLAKLVPYTTVW